MPCHLPPSPPPALSNNSSDFYWPPPPPLQQPCVFCHLFFFFPWICVPRFDISTFFRSAVFCLPFTALVYAGMRTVKKNSRYDALADCPAKYELRSTTIFFFFSIFVLMNSSHRLRVNSLYTMRSLLLPKIPIINKRVKPNKLREKREKKNENALWSWRVAAWWRVKLGACHCTPNGQIICGLVIHTCLNI